MRTAIGARAIRPSGDHAHGLAGKKAQFGQPPPQFDRRRGIGRRNGYHPRTRNPRAQLGEADVGRIPAGSFNMNAILYENRSHYYYGGDTAASQIRAAAPFLLILRSLRGSEAYEMPTLFEKIIAGELPATVLYRDPRVIAFLDIRPAAPVHILIVPNKPIPTADDIADEDESLIGHMFIVARDLARQQGIAQSGYRLIINCNADGGQEVYHLHVHLLGGKPLGPLVSRA